MDLVIDRFEENQAVIEYDGTTFAIPRILLPVEAVEGDVLTVKFEVNREITANRKRKIKSLEEDLFKK